MKVSMQAPPGPYYTQFSLVFGVVLDAKLNKRRSSTKLKENKTIALKLKNSELLNF